MINIVVISHGNLAEELIKTAKMIAGECESVYNVSLQPNETPEKFSEKLDSLMVSLEGQETLILIDMFCGTPYNVAVHFVRNQNIECLTGVNLPMLIEATLTRENTNISELAILLAENGNQSIKNVKSFLKQL